MRCTACNTEIPDSARFCPQCGHLAAAQPTQPMQPAAAQPTEPMQPAQPVPPMQATQPMQPTEPMPSQTPYVAYDQAPRYAAQGAPEPPAHYQGYAAGAGAAGAGYDGGATGPTSPAYTPAYQAAPAKKSKLPIIIIVAIVAVLAIGAGVCYAMGVGPFAGRTGGSSGGGNIAKVDQNGDPLAQLDATIKDIEASGAFDGTYKMDMSMNLGSLGEVVGMDSLEYDINGAYSIQDFDRNDLSKMKMHMDMDMDIMGEKMSMVMDFADGEATVTMDGETTTMDYDASDVLAQAGGLAYDSEKLSGYIKETRIEGDTIVIELDDEFLNKLLAESLAGEGLSGMDATFDGLELRAKIGNGSVDEVIDMTFKMAYMDYEITTDLDMEMTMTKK